MNVDSRHPDLVAYVAGSSAAVDEVAVEAHISACLGCRAEAAALRSMRRSLREKMGAHLSAEDLVAHDEGALEHQPASRSIIENHIGGCRACRSDLESLSRARRVRDEAASELRPAGSPASVAAVTRRRSIAWAAAAAAIVTLAGAGLVIAPWRRSETRSSPPSRRSVAFMPPKRSGLADRILFAGERVSLRVVLPYETSDGPFRARLERRDGSILGRALSTTPLDAETLTVEVEAPAEPGDYRLVLLPEGRPESEVIVYAFRVLAAPPARQGGGG